MKTKYSNKTISELLNYGTSILKKKGIESARLDTLIILETLLHISRTQILLNLDNTTNESNIKLFNRLLKQRSRYKPLSYILGTSYFYGYKFIVNKHVLQPRPETENIITTFNNLLSSKIFINNFDSLKVLDLGCGSGIIGITIKKLYPNINVHLSDISIRALQIAKLNAVIHTTDIRILRYNLLKNNSCNYDIIVANLPYVPLMVNINSSAKFEPKKAIYAGHDGLKFYSKLFLEISKNQNKPLYLILESLKASHKALKKLAYKFEYDLYQSIDLILVFKLRSTS